MSKVIKDLTSGRYLVDGKGFVGTQENATRFAGDQASDTLVCVKRLGFNAQAIEAVDANSNIKQNADGSSFAVSFVRGRDVQADGSVKVAVSKWTGKTLNPSSRRFATEAEARVHGARYVKIEGHLGFYVTKTQESVNSWVNQVTGKTNPLIGRGRVGR